MSDVTRILEAIGAGDPTAAEELLPLVYADLRNWEWNFRHQQLDRWDQKAVLAATNLAGCRLQREW